MKEHQIELAPNFPEFPVQFFDWEEDVMDLIGVHAHSFDEIMFIRTGKGVHQIGTNVYPIENFTIHFVPKGVKHILKDEPGAKGFTLAYDRHFLELHLKLFVASLPFYQKPMQFVYVLPAVFFDQVTTITQKIQQEIKHKDQYFSQPIFLNYISILFMDTTRAIELNRNVHSISTRHQELMNQFFQYLNENKSQKITVEQIAKALFVSPKTLNEVCKKISGKNPRTCIQESQIQNAKQLLMEGSLTISEIADALGFADVSSFSHFFKKQTGINPAAYLLLPAKK